VVSAPRAPLTAVERAVWGEWNALPADCRAPVKTIARRLRMAPGDVAFVVFPAEHFGPWHDDDEPDDQ